MTTLTASSTFTILPAATVTESVPVAVVAVPGSGVGNGRLVHPSLGTYDYALRPTHWRNFEGDVFVPPIWQSTMTLDGYANTLWSGNLRDVVVQELWDSSGGLSMPVGQLRMLLALWMNPPDPAAAYVKWYPNYISALGFDVIILDVQTATSGGGASGNAGDVELDVFSQTAGYVSQAVALKMRICGRSA